MKLTINWKTGWGFTNLKTCRTTKTKTVEVVFPKSHKNHEIKKTELNQNNRKKEREKIWLLKRINMH